MQETPTKLSFKEYLLTFLILLVVGGVGLALTLTFTLPTIGPRWLFFFFLVVLGTGLFIPATWFLNLRFPSNPPAEKIVIIRQALWFGIFIALIAWLQIGRVLTLPLAFILGGALILVELFLRLWERSRWKPQSPEF